MRLSIGMNAVTRFDGGRSYPQGFSLVELLVVIAVIAILAALLLPALSRAKGRAQLARCMSNERQMGAGLVGYVTDHSEYPGNDYNRVDGQIGPITWVRMLQPYTGCSWNQGIYDCPAYVLDFDSPLFPSASFETDMIGEYAYNRSGIGGELGLGPVVNPGVNNLYWIKESRVVAPSDMVAVGDGYVQPDKAGYGLGLIPGLTFMSGFRLFLTEQDRDLARTSMRKRHNGRFSVLFCDGHVETLKPSRLFGQDDAARRRLNNDHLPHPEVGPWPLVTD